MMDAHFHCWQLDRGDYGWLTPELKAIYRDVRIQDWWQHARAHGVTAGLLVQAAPTEAETEFLLSQAQTHPQVLGVVGWVDWLASDVDQRIARLAAHPKLVGLRPMLQDLPEPHWIAQDALHPALAAMAQQGLVFDALVRTEHLPHLDRMMRAHPDLKVVVDHGAKPSPSQELAEWAAALRHLAQSHGPHRLVCKVSGLWTELSDPQDTRRLQHWWETLFDIWGAQRLLWGSDWPVLELASDFDQWRRFSLERLALLSPAQRDAVLGGNAKRFYGL